MLFSNRYLKLLFSLFLLGISVQASSSSLDEETVRDFKAMAQQIPRSLRAQGYQGFGRLNLSQLLYNMDRVEIVAVDWVKYQSSEDVRNRTARSSAEWKRTGTDAFRIDVNKQMWNTNSVDVRSVMALHEHLGPAGFDDHDYVLSSALWFLDLCHQTSNALTDSERQSFIGFVTGKAQAKGGGITGVGGGGDVSGIETRLALLKKGLKRLARVSGGERDKVLSQIGQYFAFRKEVLRRDAKTTVVEHQSAPSEVARDIYLRDVCTKYLAIPRTQQEEVFRLLKENSPAAASEFSSASHLARFCRNTLENR